MPGVNIELHNTLQRIDIEQRLKAVLRDRIGREPDTMDIIQAIQDWFGEHFRRVHSDLNYLGTGMELGRDPHNLPPEEQNRLLEEHYALYCRVPPELQTLHRTREDSK